MRKHLALPITLVIFLFSCEKKITKCSHQFAGAAVSKMTATDLNNPDEAMLATASTSTGGYV